MKKSCFIRSGVFALLGLLIAASIYLLNGHKGAAHALNIERLPFGSYVSVYASEAWTDYMFECEIRLKPSAFEELLSGRDFRKDTTSYLMGGKITANRIPFYDGFEVAESWTWLKGTGKSIDPYCYVYVNESRTRMFLKYGTD